MMKNMVGWLVDFKLINLCWDIQCRSQYLLFFTFFSVRNYMVSSNKG